MTELRFESKKAQAADLGPESCVPDLLGEHILQNHLEFRLEEDDEIYEGYGRRKNAYPYRQYNGYTRQWNIIYSLGLLMGIGSSVIFSTLKGKSEKEYQNGNEYFSVAVIGAAFLSVIAWTVIVLFDRELLLFFGAEENLLHLAETYMVSIKFVVPCFLFVQMLAAFLRNDKNPTLATIGVLSGGIFNVFGDYVFVFIFEMGIFGAGLATAIGSVISCVVMLTHFFSKRNSLHFVKPAKKFSKWKEILVTGFPTFFIDVAMGILMILFNRQII